MTDPCNLSDAHVSPERLDELILWFSVGDRPSVGKDAFDALRELKALRAQCEWQQKALTKIASDEYIGFEGKIARECLPGSQGDS